LAGLYFGFPARVPNGDGLAYVTLATQHPLREQFLPTHLLYAPLGSLLHHLWPEANLASLLTRLNSVLALGGALLFWATLKRLGLPRAVRWISTCGLGVSFGYWLQATDVEVYMPATFFLLLSLYWLVRHVQPGSWVHPLLLSLWLSLGILFHLNLVVPLPFVYAFLWGQGAGEPFRARLRPVMLLTLGLVVCVGWPYRLVAWFLGEPHVAEWILSSKDIYPAQLDALSIPRALYGFGQTFIFLGFFWEISKVLLLVKGLFLGGVLLPLGYAFWQHRSELWVRYRRWLTLLPLWLLPQAALGTYYFGSDTERWLFVWPVVWLLIAMVSGTLMRRPWFPRLAGWVLGGMVSVNLAVRIYPLASDDTVIRQTQALSAVVSEDDWILEPGQSWVKYYTYYTGRSFRALSLWDLAGLHGGNTEALLQDLEDRLDAAFREGTRVFVACILDPDENRRRTPWQDLVRLGYDLSKIDAFFARYPAQPVVLLENPPTRLWELRPAELRTE